MLLQHFLLYFQIKQQHYISNKISFSFKRKSKDLLFWIIIKEMPYFAYTSFHSSYTCKYQLCRYSSN